MRQPLQPDPADAQEVSPGYIMMNGLALGYAHDGANCPWLDKLEVFEDSSTPVATAVEVRTGSMVARTTTAGGFLLSTSDSSQPLQVGMAGSNFQMLAGVESVASGDWIRVVAPRWLYVAKQSCVSGFGEDRHAGFSRAPAYLDFGVGAPPR